MEEGLVMKGRTNNPFGKPKLPDDERRVNICIRIKPQILAWLNEESSRRGSSRNSVIEGIIADTMNH